MCTNLKEIDQILPKSAWNWESVDVKCQKAPTSPWRIDTSGTLKISWHCKQYVYAYLNIHEPSVMFCILNILGYNINAVCIAIIYGEYRSSKKAHEYSNRFYLSLLVKLCAWSKYILNRRHKTWLMNIHYRFHLSLLLCCVHCHGMLWIDCIKQGSWIFK